MKVYLLVGLGAWLLPYSPAFGWVYEGQLKALQSEARAQGKTVHITATVGALLGLFVAQQLR